MGFTRPLQFSLALSLGALSSQALAKDYLVKFKTEQQAAFAAKGVGFTGATVKDHYLKAHLVKIAFNAARSEAKALSELAKRPDVAYVTADFKLKLFKQSAAKQRLDGQWALDKIHAERAWKHGVGARSVTVAVIDTGADINHVDLKDNIFTNPGETPGNGIDDDHNGFIDDVHGWNFVEDNSDVNDIVEAGTNPGHGTHCAGVIGGGGVDSGSFGINQKVAILPLRFMGPSGEGDLLAAVRAIDYAVLMKADVISASWGGSVPADQARPLTEAIARAGDAGVLFVAAAGNESTSNDEADVFPANAPSANVISVAASDPEDFQAIFSNFGVRRVALAAPGVDIVSTLPDGSYGPLSGTSMSAPLVAGLVGLLKSQQTQLNLSHSLTPPEIKALLQATGRKTSIETSCHCRIDAGAASDALATRKLILVPTAASFDVGATGTFSALGGHGGYTYQSSAPEVLEVKANGSLTAKSSGEATVTVTAQDGETAQSLLLQVN